MLMLHLVKVLVVQLEQTEPCQQSPKRNNDSSGWLGRLRRGKWKTPRLRLPKAAASMSKSDVKKFASTEHDKLPEKKKTFKEFIDHI